MASKRMKNILLPNYRRFCFLKTVSLIRKLIKHLRFLMLTLYLLQ
jgi:hypothetical protein